VRRDGLSLVSQMTLSQLRYERGERREESEREREVSEK
jgi:hypothetical protein